MGAIASQIASLTIVYSTVYSDADQRKHQSSASLAFVRGWPVTRKMFPFDDVIILTAWYRQGLRCLHQWRVVPTYAVSKMHMGCQEPNLTTGCLAKYNSLEAYAGLRMALTNAVEHYVSYMVDHFQIELVFVFGLYWDMDLITRVWCI